MNAKTARHWHSEVSLFKNKRKKNNPNTKKTTKKQVNMDSSCDAMMCTLDYVQGTGKRNCVKKPNVKRTSRSLETRTASDAAPQLRIRPAYSYEESQQHQCISRVGSTDQGDDRREQKKGRRRGPSSKNDTSAATAYIVLLAV